MDWSTLEGNHAMKRLKLMAAALVMLVGATGCSVNRCQSACNSCNSCPPTGGLLGSLGCRGCLSDQCSVATGCRTCGIGWQHGGLDYSEGLATGHPLHGRPGDQSGGAGGSGMAGPQGATVAYPYYSVRGPRDFLLDNPPTIGR